MSGAATVVINGEDKGNDDGRLTGDFTFVSADDVSASLLGFLSPPSATLPSARGLCPSSAALPVTPTLERSTTA
ncbi:unnamed protein product, partial [Dibothriocephalus latus]